MTLQTRTIPTSAVLGHGCSMKLMTSEWILLVVMEAVTVHTTAGVFPYFKGAFHHMQDDAMVSSQNMATKYASNQAFEDDFM